MAIVQVKDFRREEKDEFGDLLSKVASGLQVAQGVYGLSTMAEQSRLRDLQVQREQQALETGKLALEKQKRHAGLETAGIMESREFNQEYRAVDPEKIADLQKRSGLSLEPIRIKVEDPTAEGGFVEKLAIQKEDLADVRKLIKEGDIANLRMESAERLAQIKAGQRLGSANAQQLAAASGTAPLPKKVDEEFAKKYAEYTSGGEEAKDFDTIKKLEETLNFAEGNLSSGWDEQIMGMMPDKFRDIVDPADKSIEDRIKSVAQTSLKQVLGAQFTEKEGRMLLDRAYNPVQPKEENIRRMRELITSLKSQASSKKAAMDYFAQHGTLQGYRGPAVRAMPGPEPITAPTKGPTMFGTMGTPAAPAAAPQKDSDFINKYLSE